ncbi:hypothetical protein [Sinorhizobium sp. BG8]|uniref:hypothetical protein n=1 Tax=Sinorhizobium sp. BG8 TaxID=2613773 RepID=UPI00193DFA6C|nr:hypothetical protein [Sinorhizobium sp. BG8]
MTSQPETTVTVRKLANGRWGFVVKFRGVTYPVQGQFTSQLQAIAAGQAVIKAMDRKA